MKRPSYRDAIAWIAVNDESGEDTPGTDGAEQRASEYVSSVLVADLFDVPAERVGRDVMRYRTKHGADL